MNEPAVIELLKAYGRGELDHGAAQAAAWNLNSEMSWDALAAKQTGTVRNINRSPYFSAEQIRRAWPTPRKPTAALKKPPKEGSRRGGPEEEATEPTDEADDLDSSEERARSTTRRSSRGCSS